MSVILTGPCAVGKSATAELVAKRSHIRHLDFDEIRSVEIERIKPEISPCSISALDLTKCLPPILDAQLSGFVLDIGGDTVFRTGSNNETRLEQIIWLKRSYSSCLIVLTAKRVVLKQRFITSKNRKIQEFDQTWEDWQSIEHPYWFRCADQMIDTTYLAANNIAELVCEYCTSA